MTLFDHVFNLAEFRVDKKSGYEAERWPSREFPYTNNFQTSITYEVSQHQQKYFRRVYNVFDFLADLGGLFGALTPLFASIVFCIQYRSSYQFLMADIFVDKEIKKRKTIENNQNSRLSVKRQASHERRVLKKNNVQWNSCKAILLNMQIYLPAWIWCCSRCKPTDRTEDFVDGYRKLLKEISITRILKRMRVLEGKARNGISKGKWKEEKQRYSFKDYDKESRRGRATFVSQPTSGRAPDFFSQIQLANERNQVGRMDDKPYLEYSSKLNPVRE